MLDPHCELEYRRNPSLLRVIADQLRDRAPEAWERAGERQGGEDGIESHAVSSLLDAVAKWTAQRWWEGEKAA